MSSSDASATQFRPRPQQKKPAAAVGDYKDRAAMRRQGDDGEYTHVSS